MHDMAVIYYDFFTEFSRVNCFSSSLNRVAWGKLVQTGTFDLHPRGFETRFCHTGRSTMNDDDDKVMLNFLR